MTFQFKEQAEFIDQILWNCFSNSISRLSQLQVLFIFPQMTPSLDISPKENDFINLFIGLKNLQSLRILNFYPYYQNNYRQDFQRIDGSKIFLAICQALENLKQLERFDFLIPWISYPNSDIADLTKALANLQKLEYLSLRFDVSQSTQPV